MQEEWKSIKGFENSYEVSNLGNVRSIDRYCIQKNNRSEKYNHIYKGKILKQFKNKAGYMQVQLSYRYTSNLESLLYYANKKIDELTQLYELNINDKQYTINQLQQLEQILTQYEQPVNIKIRKLDKSC